MGNISFGDKLDKVVDLFQRFHRLLAEVQFFGLVDDDVFNARIKNDLVVEVKTVNGGELHRCIGLIMFPVTLLKLVAFEDVRFAISPMKLKGFLKPRICFYEFLFSSSISISYL